MWLIAFLATIAVVWILAYQGAGAAVWIGVLVASLITVTLATGIPWYLSTPLWIGATAAVLLLGVPAIRQRYVTALLLRQFRKVIPPMSRTEREALEAGSVWWDAELFSGRPDWERLLATPPARLSERERAFLDGPVETLCEMLDDWYITHEEKDLPEEVWAFLRQHRFFGLILPEAYGGLGFSARAHSEVVMKLASRSIVAAVTVMVPNSLGPGKLLLHYGTRRQREHYLPRLARGEEIPCFALTGPDAGSDAGAIPDRGVVAWGEWQGERVLGVRLNWEKRYITLGPVATLIGLAFRLEDPEGLLGSDPAPGITVALIPRDTPGIEIGERHIPLDIPFQNGPNRGRDVFIPLDWVIGGRNGVGQGWRMLVESLSEGRGISLPALATGAGKMACRFTGAYARVRQQFHQPIGRFEGVEEALARIAGFTYQMDAARGLTLSALDAGESPSVISAIVKYHLTERYRRVINDAMDVQGGSGICLGPANLVGRAYQAIPISITVEGANILTRSMIIFGQGAIRCHPFVRRELEAAHDPDPERALRRFDDALFGHIRFLLGNAGRSLLAGLTRGHLTPAPVTGSTRRWFRHLNWMSSAFALCSDLSMITLGGSLKRKERLSARLGDILSELYLASAVLKRFEDQGRPAADLSLLEWSCQQSLYRIQEAFRTLFRNLPARPLSWLLRLLVFPSGLPYHRPSDRLDHAVARLLLESGGARDRLTAGIFVADDPDDRSAQLERALRQAVRVAPLEKTLREALRQGLIQGGALESRLGQAFGQGLLSGEECQALRTMERLRRQVIRVDAFTGYGGAAERPGALGPTPLRREA